MFVLNNEKTNNNKDKRCPCSAKFVLLKNIFYVFSQLQNEKPEQLRRYHYSIN